MSELTDWERDRLAALEQQLSVEDPELASRLTGPVHPLRSRAMARIALATIWVSAVLLPCGAALEDRSSVLVALLAPACGPVLLWRALVPTHRLTRLAAREGR